jgi:hypothetical protein
MPITSIIILATIVSAFVVFAAVLAWGERQTRHLGRQNIAQRSDRHMSPTAAQASNIPKGGVRDISSAMSGGRTGEMAHS